MRRPLRGEVAPLPLYEIDAGGRASHRATLSLVYPEGSWMDLAGSGWPVPDESRDGWWAGLPYPLVDMRHQGYLGRQFARATHQLLAVSPNPEEWSDDDVVHVLARSGIDMPGNLVLGDAALAQWQAGLLAPPQPLAARGLGAAYAALAEQAVATGMPGSSAGGEFPKFPALRDLAGSRTPHVLVKFSGADGSPAVRRWADLLVCEHLALQCVGHLGGVQGAASRILTQAGRSFLEVERFDRHGAFGRSRLCSLTVLNAALVVDAASDWARLAQRLGALGLLAADHVAAIERLWWFGRLIANSDMHAGNLSFVPGVDGLMPAPVYDMQPMAYAPLAGGEVPVRSFAPPLPLPGQRDAWLAACRVAIDFWMLASEDGRISEGFRAICVANGQMLEGLAGRV